MPDYKVIGDGWSQIVAADAVRVEHGVLIFTVRGSANLLLSASNWLACERQDGAQG